MSLPLSNLQNITLLLYIVYDEIICISDTFPGATIVDAALVVIFATGLLPIAQLETST